jgi:KDO2-lipid IV(A) lauroyltransferase
VAALVNLFPITWSTWMARRVGDLIFFFIPKRRKTALENLNIAYGDTLSGEEKRRIAQEAIRNLATTLMEFFRIPSMLHTVKESFEIEGRPILDEAFAKGKGVIFVVSHLGSWEYLEFLFYLTGHPCAVIVRNTQNPYIFSWIQKLRKMTTVDPLPKRGSIRKVLSELKKNRLVAILIDQADQEGRYANFFNKPALTTALPARLAQKTGARLVPGYCLRTGCGRYKIIIRPELPVEEGDDGERLTTEKLNQWLEKEILAHPEQWIWTHRRWKELKQRRYQF